jgi:hypothetical protein
LRLRLSQRLPLKRSRELPRACKAARRTARYQRVRRRRNDQGEPLWAAVVLTTTALVAMVTVTPVCLAIAVAIDSVAVLISIRAMIVGPMIANAADIATRNAHEGSDRAQYSCPIEFVHLPVPLEVVVSRNDAPGSRRMRLCQMSYVLHPSASFGTNS